MLIWWLLPDSYLQCLPVFWVSGCLQDISMWFSQDVSNSAHLNMIVSHLFLTPCYPLFLCLSEWLCHHHPASHQSQTPRAIVDSVPHPSFSVSPQAVPTASEIPSRVLVLSLCIRTTLGPRLPPGLFQQAFHLASLPLTLPPVPQAVPCHCQSMPKPRWNSLPHVFVIWRLLVQNFSPNSFRQFSPCILRSVSSDLRYFCVAVVASLPALAHTFLCLKRRPLSSCEWSLDHPAPAPPQQC